MKHITKIPIEMLEYKSITSAIQLSFSCYVFIYVTRGSVQIESSGESYLYQRSDLTLLGPDRECLIRPGQEGEIFLLGLAKAYMEDHLSVTALSRCDSTRNPDQDFIPLKRALTSTADLYALQNPGLDYTLLGNCYMILGELFKLHEDRPSHEGRDRHSDRIHAIADYIDQHFRESLSLQNLADEFYLTPQYLSAFFHENFKTNFKSYLNEKRLYYSLRDLRNTDLSISEIAMNNGFSSFSSYRRNFQKVYDMSPSDYRARSRVPEDSQAQIVDPAWDHRVSTDLQTNVPPVDVGPEYPRADHSIRQSQEIAITGPVISLKRKDLILNIGSVQNMMSGVFRDRMLKVAKELEFPYVRMMGVVTSSFIPMVLPNYNLHFQNLDTVLPFFYDNHMIPFIELSRLQFNFTFEATQRPKTLYVQKSNRWFRLFQDFLDHITKRYPMDWLAQWKFEVWMTPADTADSYAEDFLQVQQILHAYIPKASLGGPGYNDCVTPAGMDEILSAFQRRQITPSFMTAYLNSYMIQHDSQGKNLFAISPDPDYPLRRVADLCKRIKTRHPNMPFYITEWNSAYFSESPIAYSRFQAAFLVKTQKEISPWCDMSGYWLFSDAQRLNNQMQQRSLFTWGQGLLNAEYIRTASYYAYLLLHRMGSEIVASGKNFLLCQRGQGNYQMLTFNYRHFLSQNSPDLNDDVSFEHLYDLFESGTPIDSHFQLTGLTPGLYRIERIILDEYHGSMLDVLIGEFRHSNLNKIEFLQKAKNVSVNERNYEFTESIPERRTIYTKCDGQLTLDAYLQDHSLAYWEIQIQV